MKAVANAGKQGITNGSWVGHGAKRFGNKGEWFDVYAMMGWPTLWITGLFFASVAWLGYRNSGEWDGTYPVLLLATQQLFLLCYALALTHAVSLWVGAEGIEVRTWGVGIKQFAWSQIVRVELYRLFGMRCVRVFLLGKRSPVYLPLYFKQTDAFFTEAAVWLGRDQTVQSIPISVTLPKTQAVTATSYHSSQRTEQTQSIGNRTRE